jgi:predicted transcriptional regulator
MHSQEENVIEADTSVAGPETASLRAIGGSQTTRVGKVANVNRLGDLERAIMDVLWGTPQSLTVREVSAQLTERDLAHTTVMTVLDRLAKKGFARRERDGRAWRYRPAATREAYVTELMLTALDQTGDRSAALARFARSVSGAEAEALRASLDEIEGDGGGL